VLRQINLVIFVLAVFSQVSCGGQSPTTTTTTPSATTPADSKREDIPKNLVRLYLLADVTAVSPGQELRIAARFDIEPSWHIYWTNPGEAGIPTTVEFGLPPGFSAEPIRYPGPVSFDGGEGIISYGYQELAMLSTEVTAPLKLNSNKKLHFSATASWLACREMCIPGKAEVRMSLDVATQAVPSAPANETMFAAHENRLPSSNDKLALEWKSGSPATLEVFIPSAQRVEYFPSVTEQSSLAGQLAIPENDGVKLILSFKNSAPHQVTGVLGINNTDQRTIRYVQLTVPNPSTNN